MGEWREVSGARSEERWQKGNRGRDCVNAVITNVLMWTKKSPEDLRLHKRLQSHTL